MPTLQGKEDSATLTINPIKNLQLLLRLWLRDIRERAFLDLGIEKLLKLWLIDTKLITLYGICEIALEDAIMRGAPKVSPTPYSSLLHASKGDKENG